VGEVCDVFWNDPILNILIFFYINNILLNKLNAIAPKALKLI
jgi:hypothetical protein